MILLYYSFSKVMKKAPQLFVFDIICLFRLSDIVFLIIFLIINLVQDSFPFNFLLSRRPGMLIRFAYGCGIAYHFNLSLFEPHTMLAETFDLVD